MNCPKCKSDNTQVQVVGETHYKKGHGCLFTILFGIYYWTWLIVKWLAKYTVYAIYQVYKWILVLPVKLVISLIKKTGFSISNDLQDAEWIKSMMRRRGKTYNTQKSVAVCQQCGNRWTV